MLVSALILLAIIIIILSMPRPTGLAIAFHSCKFKDIFKSNNIEFIIKDFEIFNVGYVLDPSTCPRDSTLISDIYPRVVFIGFLGKWRYWKCIEK